MNFFKNLLARLRKYDETHDFTCDICGREVFGDEHICKTCVENLPWNDGVFCPFCGRRVKEEGACLECKQKPLAVKKARSVFLHEGEAMRLVWRLKNGERHLLPAFEQLALATFLREFQEVDSVTFIPMTQKAEKKRGYNQSRLFAERLANATGLECLDVAVKSRETPSQKSLGREERERNLEGVFHIQKRKEVRGKRIVIVDDTMTTGATASALATALKRAGASECYLFSFTSVERKNPFGKPPKHKKSWGFLRKKV